MLLSLPVLPLMVPLPAGSRGTVVFKSPETGTISMSNMGGHWGARMRMAGYECVAVIGKADKPKYIMIDDDKVEIRSADHLWGKDIPALQEALEKEIGDPKIEVISIGPAGEKLVLLSCVANHTALPAKEEVVRSWVQKISRQLLSELRVR